MPPADGARPDEDLADERGRRGQGAADGVADQLEQLVAPVVGWTRRVLRVPVAFGVGAALIAGLTVVVSAGTEPSDLAVAAAVAVVVALPAVGVWRFIRALTDLTEVSDTVREAPANAGALRDELTEARRRLGDLRGRGLRSVARALRWLRDVGRALDRLGGAAVRGAITALHPLRLAFVLLLCVLCLVALPLALTALVVAGVA